MASEGRTPLLKESRWLLLKREENLKAEQRFRLPDLLRYNLKTVRAYLLKEAF
jgi:transposase